MEKRSRKFFIYLRKFIAGNDCHSMPISEQLFEIQEVAKHEQLSVERVIEENCTTTAR